MTTSLELTSYWLLGRSGLRVSPLALGTMTFGADWGWGADEADARRIFDAFVDRGGNFIDTANAYTNGSSERLVGKFAEGRRDRLVISTKYTMGMSDTPAWQISRMQAIADRRGWSPFIALQSEYSLVERTAERDLIPMAEEMGLGVIPWSPLANGVLSGKYSRADLAAGDLTLLQGSRKDVAIGNGSLSERSLDIADVVKAVAAETGNSPAQIALAWTLLNSGVAATLVGARTPKQLNDNLGALEVSFDDEQRARLEKVSAITLGFPRELLRMPTIVRSIGGGTVLPARTW